MRMGLMAMTVYLHMERYIMVFKHVQGNGDKFAHALMDDDHSLLPRLRMAWTTLAHYRHCAWHACIALPCA